MTTPKYFDLDEWMRKKERRAIVNAERDRARVKREQDRAARRHAENIRRHRATTTGEVA